MYKSDYFTKEQMTQYKMKSDMDKGWIPTLDYFSLLFAQCKAYGDNCAANSGFKAATMYKVPLDRTILTTMSSRDLTSRDFYIKRLEESLAIARKYIAKTPATKTSMMTPPNPITMMLAEMEAQQKQVYALMKQNSDLVVAITKANPTAPVTNGGRTRGTQSGHPPT